MVTHSKIVDPINILHENMQFHVPFFCTSAAGAVAEIQTVCFVNIEFLERKIMVACPHRLPKLPESTQRKQAIPNKGSLFYSHCA
jgi:hypothetical protein